MTLYTPVSTHSTLARPPQATVDEFSFDIDPARADEVSALLHEFMQEHTRYAGHDGTTTFHIPSPNPDVQIFLIEAELSVRLTSAAISCRLAVHGQQQALALQKELLSKLYVPWATGGTSERRLFGLSRRIMPIACNTTTPDLLLVDVYDCGEQYGVKVTVEGGSKWLIEQMGAAQLEYLFPGRFDATWANAATLLCAPPDEAARLERAASAGRSDYALHDVLLELRDTDVSRWPQMSFGEWAATLPVTSSHV